METSASFEARSAPPPHPANRKQDQAKPDCGDTAKALSHTHREATVTAPVLDSTRFSIIEKSSIQISGHISATHSHREGK